MSSERKIEKMNRAVASQSFKKGFPLSSTPIQSFEDSGYFGSSGKKSSSKAKALNACSPIKEFSFRNILPKQSYIEQDSFVFRKPESENVTEFTRFAKCELSSNAGIHELAEPDVYSPHEIHKYNLPNYQNSSEQCFQNSSHDLSSCRDSLYSIDSSSKSGDIKYELFPGLQSEDSLLSTVGDFKYSKRTKVDFVHQLKLINCDLIISNILSHLSAKELCKASCVSKEWNEAVSEDRKANARKEKFLTEQTIFLTGPSKENRLGMKNGPAREHKKAFSTLTNTFNATEEISSIENRKTRFDSFISEAKKGHTKLLKCPICSYASKLKEGKCCICTNCSHKFCCDCYGPIYENHVCSKPQLPKTIIGSKQSKKNLRRL